MDFNYAVLPALIVLGAILIVVLSIRRIVSQRLQALPAWRRAVERTLLLFLAVIAVAAAASSAFNAITLHRYLANPPGQLYRIDGHTMRIDCMGSGSPTVVLDAGLGDDGLIWSGVQPELAKTTRVCSYDRPGFGWSDALPPPRDADRIAGELHALLSAAKIEGPIVLMGHSLAGIYIRDYAARYPTDVAGLIFVDASTPAQDQNPVIRGHGLMRRPPRIQIALIEAAFILGIPRLAGACSHAPPGLDAGAAKLLSEDRCRHSFQGPAEMESFDRSSEEAVQSGPYGALPILIFSHDPAKGAGAGEPADLEAVWSRMQENLKSLSTRSRRIIAKNSGHYIQLDRPDLIGREVPLFIEQIRGTAPQPSNYGSTTAE
jgi:pimeloyl-ACP methyl ester carboxylesterase